MFVLKNVVGLALLPTVLGHENQKGNVSEIQKDSSQFPPDLEDKSKLNVLQKYTWYGDNSGQVRQFRGCKFQSKDGVEIDLDPERCYIKMVKKDFKRIKSGKLLDGHATAADEVLHLQRGNQKIFKKFWWVSHIMRHAMSDDFLNHSWENDAWKAGEMSSIRQIIEIKLQKSKLGIQDTVWYHVVQKLAWVLKWQSFAEIDNELKGFRDTPYLKNALYLDTSNQADITKRQKFFDKFEDLYAELKSQHLFDINACFHAIQRRTLTANTLGDIYANQKNVIPDVVNTLRYFLKPEVLQHLNDTRNRIIEYIEKEDPQDANGKSIKKPIDPKPEFAELTQGWNKLKKFHRKRIINKLCVRIKKIIKIFDVNKVVDLSTLTRAEKKERKEWLKKEEKKKATPPTATITVRETEA